MAYERTWAFSFDNAHQADSTLDATRYQMWGMKALLLGELGGLVSGLWTVYGSSDGVTAGMDGVDRWGSTYDPSKLVRANSGDGFPRSWMVLRSPTMNGVTFYINFAFDQGVDTYLGSWCSKAAPTGNLATATPTATDQWVWGVLGTQPWGVTSPTAPYLRLNMCLSATGDFIFFANVGGNIFYHTAMMVIAPVDCNAGDNYPIITFRYFQAAFSPVYASAFYVNVQHTNQTGGVADDRVGLCSLPMGGNDSTNPFTEISGITPDILTGKWPTLPMEIVVRGANTSPYWHARGRLPDMHICIRGASGGYPSNLVVRDGSGITHIALGSCLIPANAVPKTG